MIIDSLLLEFDDEGYSYKISGESLESILKRRIAWNEVTLSGNFQSEIKKLIDRSIISPTDSDRKIDGFIFVESQDPEITKLTIDAKYSADETIYDIIETNCQEFEIGFKVVFTESNEFAFSLYKGVDRTYEQNLVPYVVFSPAFDNLTNSSFLVSTKDFKNVALVKSENLSKVVGSSSGLDRREIYVDVSSSEEESTPLEKKGNEALADNKKKEAFEGEANVLSMFLYGQDFFIGDMVQLEDAYGNSGKSIVSEIVFSVDEEGEKIYPTFIVPENEGGEEK